MKWVFWVSLGLILFTYGGYPAWLRIRMRWRFRPVRSSPVFPVVSIVMAVHNEAKVLRRKLENLSQLSYPSDRLEIIVVSDGSADGTNEMLKAWAGELKRPVLCEQHEGKAAALNRGMQEARGEVIVFTDARQRIDPEALSRLTANFADPSVGCVSGELMLKEPQEDGTRGHGFGLYWHLEKMIRLWEGATGSVVGATGALYAIRKNLIVPLPEVTILDDVYLPLHVARRGKRVVFESTACAYDSLAATEHEFRRKVRTLTGNYQLLQLAPWLLSAANPVRFEFICHKLLRLVMPFVLFCLLVSSIFAQGVPYRLAFELQLIFYATAALALFHLRLGIISKLADAASAFVVLNAAAAIAFVYFALGKKEVWVR